MSKIYGLDFGGTNARIGVLDTGTNELQILKEVPMTSFGSNRELSDFVLGNIPQGSDVGACSAGVIDEENLIVRDAPNVPIREQLTFAKDLRLRGDTVTLTNDMKAAVQAASRYLEGVGHERVMAATFSSGFNVALADNGRNVTTAEFGHQRYKQDSDLYCGCGEKGHLEVYVSGNGARGMAIPFFAMSRRPSHPIMELVLAEHAEKAEKEGVRVYTQKDLADFETYWNFVGRITAKHVYEAYRQEPNMEPQRGIRNTQVEAIADSFGRMVSSFNPVDIIVLMGSQTKDADVLINPAIEKYKNSGGSYQIDSIRKPEIVITKKQDEIGLLGAIAYFQSRQN